MRNLDGPKVGNPVLYQDWPWWIKLIVHSNGEDMVYIRTKFKWDEPDVTKYVPLSALNIEPESTDCVKWIGP